MLAAAPTAEQVRKRTTEQSTKKSGIHLHLGSAAGTHSSERSRASMYILRIGHPVPNFDGWKQAFDSDPVGREQSGVRRYQIFRAIDEPNYVMIDLEFDTVSQAETLLAAMRVVWGRVEGTIMMNPQARIVEAVETKEY
jgi:hypothetical protein